MKSLRLVDVYQANVASLVFLYDLLRERDPIANISHKKMPTYNQHRSFVESRPYLEWYFVYADDEAVGAIYLTQADEIGVSILKDHQGNGYAKRAIRLLMDTNPGKRFLANIAPDNRRSIAMFEKLGFKLCQLTFEKEEQPE